MILACVASSAYGEKTKKKDPPANKEAKPKGPKEPKEPKPPKEPKVDVATLTDDPLLGKGDQIQGEELRISSKSRDDLQAVQALIKEQDYDFAVQYVNYR